MDQARPKNRTIGFLSCALAGALWGCGFFFGKIALEEMNVGSMVLFRFLFACVGLLPLALTHRPKFSPSAWRTLALAACLGIPLQFLLQFRGLSLTTVSHASLMVGTLPVVLALGAAVFAHERLDVIGWIALVGSTLGAALIALGANHSTSASGPTLAGDLLVVVSLFIALFWILINQRLMKTNDHIAVSVYGTLLGTAMLSVWVPLTWGLPPMHSVSLKAWAALAASGLLCTATTTLLWNFGLTQVPASQAGILLNMEPLIGSLLGVFILHEHLGGLAWLGGALILAAAITLTTRGKQQELAEAILAET